MVVLGLILTGVCCLVLGWILRECWEIHIVRKAETKRLRDTSSGGWLD